MTLLFLLFLVLDFQCSPVTDLPYQDFRVTDISELAFAGCSMNPMDGYETIPADFTTDWVETFNDQTNTPTSTPLQDLESQNVVAPMRMIDDNPVIPPSPPESPQPIATPEPPPIAILALCGIALLYLLFGYSRRMRLYRRS
jgi:hypothetical protein